MTDLKTDSLEALDAAPGEEAPARPRVWTALLDVLLSVDPHQRLRIARSLLAGLVFFVCVCMIFYLSSIGRMDSHQGAILAGGISISCLGFYVALRSGFNRRFAEPALTLPQVLAGLSWISVSYALAGAAHGGVLVLFSLVLVFGIFNMSIRYAIVSAVYGVVVIGATMLYKGRTDPLLYPPETELANFVFVAATMLTIAFLSVQITRMRDALKAQKRALETALERIQRLAAHDELTGLINRRRMLEVLADHALRQKRQSIGFAIAMLDIDHFKKINDNWGHAVGDDVLHGFAEAARRTLRESDVLGRWGGEEFLLLMPATSNGHPSIGLDRLRALLAAQALSADAPDLRVTFSAGIASHRPNESVQNTIRRADQALYAAKAAGRDRTIIADEA